MPVQRSKHSPTASRSNKKGGLAKSRRANSYNKNYARIAKTLCELGATTAKLAEAFDVSEETIAAWQARHKEFAKACQINLERSDDQVEQVDVGEPQFGPALGYLGEEEGDVPADRQLLLRRVVEGVEGDLVAETAAVQEVVGGDAVEDLVEPLVEVALHRASSMQRSASVSPDSFR